MQIPTYSYSKDIFSQRKQNCEPILRKIVIVIKFAHINGYEQNSGLPQTSNNEHLLQSFVLVL